MSWKTAFLLIFLGIAAAKNVQAQPLCAIEQITTSTASNGPIRTGVAGDGSAVLISGFGDYGTGGNPDGGIDLFAVDVPAAQAMQITEGPSDHQLSSGNVSDDGRHAPFISRLDLTGENPDGGREIFLIDMTTLVVTQVTQLANDGFMTAPVISGNGEQVAFFSSLDFTGQNADTSIEVFLLDLADTSIQQLTDWTGAANGTYRLAIDADGSRVAIAAPADFVGTNADFGQEIFSWDGTVEQITDDPTGTFASVAPDLSADGTLLAFSSTLDPFGTNPDEQNEIFLYDFSTSLLTQITASSPGASSRPSLNGSGSRLFFASNGDLTGQNGDLSNEILFYDLDAAQFAQVTDTTGGDTFQPMSTLPGDQVLFFSNLNFTGGNPDLNVELFQATCSDLPPIAVFDVPALDDLGLALLAAALIGAAVLLIRRRF